MATALTKIFNRMRSHNTLVCVGLDPVLAMLPMDIASRQITPEQKVLEFLCAVVGVTAPHVCAFKAQKAFFDVFPEGHELLKQLIAYVHENHPGIPALLDCKIGDIENTMSAYMQNIFVNLQADGVVVNPYMGDDVMIPLAEWKHKAIVVLVKTSNPGGNVMQDILLQDGRKYWEHTLDLVINRWNKNGNMIPVLSSNAGSLAHIRNLIPDNMPILLAGIGAQGGDHERLTELLNGDNEGVFVNSSRGILYPGGSGFWLDEVTRSVIELKDLLNGKRRSHEQG